MWYKNISGTLLAIGYTKNEYDQCVFNKYDSDGVQITVGIHVKELLITSEPDRLHEELEAHLYKTYEAITVKERLAIDYVGMTFDLSHQGTVRVTMPHCVQDIITGVGCRHYSRGRATLRKKGHCTKGYRRGTKWFHAHTAKMLYLAKESDRMLNSSIFPIDACESMRCR